MNISYTWNILSIYTRDNPEQNLKDVVFKVIWEKRGTDDAGHTYGHVNVTNLELDPSEIPNFVSYNKLTEDLIWSWVKSRLTCEDAINQQIYDNLETMVNPIKTPPLPWLSPTVGSTGATGLIIGSTGATGI